MRSSTFGPTPSIAVAIRKISVFFINATGFRIAIGIWKVRARGVCLPSLLLCRCVPVVSLCALCCFWCCVPVVLSLLSLLLLVLLLLLLYRLLLLPSLLLVLTLLLLLLALLLSLLMRGDRFVPQIAFGQIMKFDFTSKRNAKKAGA